MNLEMMTQTLRWTFWSFVYLAVVMFALVLCLGSMSPYLPLWARWAAFGVFVVGILADVRAKTHPSSKRPPAGGESVPVRRRP